MAIVYRTTGAWGAGKGSDLTAAEVDGNFYDLDQRVVAIEVAAPAVDEIASFQLVGSQLTIFTSEGGEFGPFTVPVAVFHWTDDWQTSHAYSELDLFRYIPESQFDDGGVYMVLQDHTSDATTFDPNAELGGLPLYRELFFIPPHEPIEFNFSVSGVPGTEQVLFERVTLKEFSVEDTEVGFENVIAHSGTMPATSQVLIMRRIDPEGGSVIVASLTIDSSGVATIEVDDPYGSDAFFSTGDLLQIATGVSVDASHADFSVTLRVAAE